MAVYTSVDVALLHTFLARYDLGRLTTFQGIENGIDNTNYRLQTDTGAYILTLS